MAHDVSHETDHAALDSDQDRTPTGVVAGDRPAQLLDPLLELALGVQDAGNSGQVGLYKRAESELGQQPVEVPSVEQLDVYLGIHLAEPPDLAVLLSDQRLLHRGQLKIEIEIGQVKVGGHHLYGAVAVPPEWERERLVVPAETVEV